VSCGSGNRLPRPEREAGSSGRVIHLGRCPSAVADDGSRHARGQQRIPRKNGVLVRGGGTNHRFGRGGIERLPAYSLRLYSPLNRQCTHIESPAGACNSDLPRNGVIVTCEREVHARCRDLRDVVARIVGKRPVGTDLSCHESKLLSSEEVDQASGDRSRQVLTYFGLRQGAISAHREADQLVTWRDVAGYGDPIEFADRPSETCEQIANFGGFATGWQPSFPGLLGRFRAVCAALAADSYQQPQHDRRADKPPAHCCQHTHPGSLRSSHGRNNQWACGVNSR